MKSTSGGADAMKTKGGSNRMVSCELLQQAILFFTDREKEADTMQRAFAAFTERVLKEVQAASQRASEKAIGVLWHDFLFIFFQYFIGIIFVVRCC